METQELHRGRLIDHLQLVVKDLAASRRFYEAVFKSLGHLTGRHHLAFQASDRAMVAAFHQAGLAHGGRDNGAPGERPYHPGYYAAFLLDPDGNNIEVVYHGEAKRSAVSVKIDF
jgi:catechol 2,3-dioxygenase-like lactoylglutathione lyase family enzyme